MTQSPSDISVLELRELIALQQQAFAASQEAIAKQQQMVWAAISANTKDIAEMRAQSAERDAQFDEKMSALTAKVDQNQEQIALLAASMVELRNLHADFVRRTEVQNG